MLSNFALEFPLHKDIVYLNHAAVSPWPRRTAEAVRHFAMENMTVGSKHYALWEQKEILLRQRLQQLLNAPSADDIALLKNTSEGLSIVAYGLEWKAGDNIIITNQEFPSNRIVWESLQSQGVIIKQADISATETPEMSLLSLIDERTRLIAVSSVQYVSGLRLDLAKIGTVCQKNDTLFCIDAIQSLGALQCDVQAYHADFVVADGHKWMLAPEGLAVFYCKAERRDQLKLKQFGWHMVENHGDFDSKTWTVAKTGRRFEAGSPNMLGIHALEASLSLLEEVGMNTVETLVLKNARYLINNLAQLPHIQLDSSLDLNKQSGILTFRHKRIETSTLFCQLREYGILCAQRGGGIRLSPHFYLQQFQLDHVLRLISEQ